MFGPMHRGHSVYIYIYIIIVIIIIIIIIIYIHIHIHTHTHNYLYTYAHMYIYIYICMYVRMYIYIYVHTYLIYTYASISSSLQNFWKGPRKLFRSLYQSEQLSGPGSTGKFMLSYCALLGSPQDLLGKGSVPSSRWQLVGINELRRVFDIWAMFNGSRAAGKFFRSSTLKPESRKAQSRSPNAPKIRTAGAQAQYIIKNVKPQYAYPI